MAAFLFASTVLENGTIDFFIKHFQLRSAATTDNPWIARERERERERKKETFI